MSTAKICARRLAQMTDKDIMVICGGGYGKTRQDQLLDDLHAVIAETLGEKELLRAQLEGSAYDPTDAA